MTRVPHLVSVRCTFCSRERPPHRVHRLQSNQVVCDHCMEWHHHAIAFLGGAVPPGCQQCRATWEYLRDSTPGVEIRMYVVPKDGILQLLCGACVQTYLPKRADLYKGTQFGTDILNL